MNEGVVIRPTADAVQPTFKLAKLAIAELCLQVLKQQDGQNLFLENSSREQFVGNLHQEREIPFAQNIFPKSPRRAAKMPRIPSVRLDLFFEKPLHSRGVFSRTSPFESAAKLGGDIPSRTTFPETQRTIYLEWHRTEQDIPSISGWESRR